MGVLKVSGTLSAGPASVSEGGFPSLTSGCPLSLLAGTAGKTYGAGTGIQSQNVNSAGAFVALVLGGVATGTALYFKCAGPMQLELTMADTPANLVSVIHVQGLVGPIEFPQSHELLGLRVKGVGQIEYMVVGNQ